MRWLRNRSGFTLVELVLALAIGALLLVAVVAARGALIQNTEFTSAMDGAQNLMRQIQNEANQALSINQLGAGQSAELVFGRLVQLSSTFSNPATIKTWTLVASKDDTGNIVGLNACDEQDSAFQDGVTYNPSSTPSTTSVIFTRNTGNSANANAAANGGQVFVAPIDTTDSGPESSPNPAIIGGTLVTGVAVPSCPNGSSLPADQVPPPSPLDPCALLGGDQRGGGSGSAVTFTCPQLPTAPTFTATDGTNTAYSNPTGLQSNKLSTKKNALNITVTLPSPAPQPSESATLTDGSATTPISFAPGATTATIPYTLDSTIPTHYLYVTWQYNGITSNQSNSIEVDIIQPTTCDQSGPTYECGLKGAYTDRWGDLQTVALDGAKSDGSTGNGYSIGTNLGSGQSAYPDLTSTLQLRTGDNNISYDGAEWTGQIYLNKNAQEICLNSDNDRGSGTRFEIGSSGWKTASNTYTQFGTTYTDCGSFDGGVGGGWYDIDIQYHNNDNSSPTNTFIQHTDISSSAAADTWVQLGTPNSSQAQDSICIFDTYHYQVVGDCMTTTNQSDIQTCQFGQLPQSLVNYNLGNSTLQYDINNPQPNSSNYVSCRVNYSGQVPTYTEIDGSRLRVKPFSTQGPPNYSSGLTAYYLLETGYDTGNYSLQNVSTATGVGTSSNPKTAPDWQSILKSNTGDSDPTSRHMGVVWVGNLHIVSSGQYQFCIGNSSHAIDDYGDIYMQTDPTNPSQYTLLAEADDIWSYASYQFDPYYSSTGHCGSAVSLSPGYYPIYMDHYELKYQSSGSDADFYLTYQDVGKSGSSPQEVPIGWWGTADNTHPPVNLPGYQQLVDDITAKARRTLVFTPVAPAASKLSLSSVLHGVAQALAPHTAWAASGSCDNNILNPANYLQNCPNFVVAGGSSVISVPVEVTGDTTHQAVLKFDTNANTITWSTY